MGSATGRSKVEAVGFSLVAVTKALRVGALCSDSFLALTLSVSSESHGVFFIKSIPGNYFLTF
jgi:hypothetical protein